MSNPQSSEKSLRHRLLVQALSVPATETLAEPPPPASPPSSFENEDVENVGVESVGVESVGVESVGVESVGAQRDVLAQGAGQGARSPIGSAAAEAVLAEAAPEAWPAASAAQVASAAQEECVSCDFIEQRLGHRSQACMPRPLGDAASPDSGAEIFTLSRSARAGYGSVHEATAVADLSSPALTALASAAPGEHDGSSGAEATATPSAAVGPAHSVGDEPWQHAFNELNAALQLAKSRVPADSPTPASPYAAAASRELADLRQAHVSDQALLESAQQHAETFLPPSGINFAEADAAIAKQTVAVLPAPAPRQKFGPKRLSTALRRAGERSRAGSGPLLAGLGLLIMTMGFLPFAPSVLGSLMDSDAGTAAGRRQIAASTNSAPAVKAALAGGNMAALVRPMLTRGELSVARINRVRPGVAAPLGVVSSLNESQSAGAFAVLRDLPHGAIFSHGQALGASLWTVPMDQVALLQMTVPVTAPDVSLVTIEALSVESVLLAQTVTVIVVERAATAGSGGHTTSLHEAGAPRQWPGEDMTVDLAAANLESDVTLMRVARLQAPVRNLDVSWSRVEPRHNLVHVVLAAPVLPVVHRSYDSLPPRGGPSLDSTSATGGEAGATSAAAVPANAFRPASHPHPEPARAAAPAVGASASPSSARKETGVSGDVGRSREVPFEVEPMRPPASRVKGSFDEDNDAAASASTTSKPETGKQHRLVRRPEKSEVEVPADGDKSRELPPGKRAMEEKSKSAEAVPLSPKRPRDPSSENRLGGPLPERKSTGNVTPAKKPDPQPAQKGNGRGEGMSSNGGI